ncbi:thiolase domain-containing protein [Candidimonas sp. SYP-B2681]|uniref:thiolase domain-containing protein n=1 Tax=Candidimonas sp. SYP-B2681 TaxID=2497686 RepID=UPI001F4252EA|nr:thiolase domain-containing protein [Candidimonas sp. SYP-B2681]
MSLTETSPYIGGGRHSRMPCIVGAYEHPTRYAPDTTVARLHADVALGAIEDAGINKEDIDGYFCSGDAPGMGPTSMAEYLNLKTKYVDSTDVGGASYLNLVNHAVRAINENKCNIALITLAGRPLSEGVATGIKPKVRNASQPDYPWEQPYDIANVSGYAMCAMRHMYEYGTTAEQLAMIKVAASHHAQFNANAKLQRTVTVEDVVNSPVIADPLRRLDCCVITDGGGAIILARPEIARTLRKPLVRVIGAGESVKHQNGGYIDLTYTGAAWSGAIAFEEADVKPQDIQYVSLYDSFTITVLMLLEDLGFCEKGEGGRFVEDGNLISGVGRLPFNTDGGGLCNNHPANRGGMTKIIEAVRQLRGEAHPAVQVPNCALALVQGIGGMLATRHGSATLILERG